MMITGLRLTQRIKDLLNWADTGNISDKETLSSITVGDLREAAIRVESPAPAVEGEGSELAGHRVQVPVEVLEFDVAGNTIWVQSAEGTVLRIKCEGTISVERCETSPVSHMDLMVSGGMHVCLAEKDYPE